MCFKKHEWYDINYALNTVMFFNINTLSKCKIKSAKQLSDYWNNQYIR